jgi:hypothetical protein
MDYIYVNSGAYDWIAIRCWSFLLNLKTQHLRFRER